MSDVKQQAIDAKNRGNAAFTKGDFAKAVEEFTTAINLDATDHIFYSNRSGAYASMKQFDKALEDANKCIEKKRDFAKGWGRKATALLGLNKLEECKSTCEEGLKLDAANDVLKSSLSEVNQKLAAGKNPMAKMFGPEMWPKLMANATTKEYLKDDAFVAKLRQLQSNPNSLGDLSSDPRLQQVLGVVLGLGADFGAPGGAAGASAAAGGGAAPRGPPGGPSPGSPNSPPTATKPSPSSSASSGGGATVMDEADDEDEDVEIVGNQATRKEPEKPKPAAVAPAQPSKAATDAAKAAKPANASSQASDKSESKVNAQAEVEKNKGTEFYKKKEFDQALVHYTKAHELEPTNITGFTNLAAVHLEKKEYDKAIELCREGIKAGQEHKADFKLVAKAYVRIGNAYMKQDKLGEAIEAYNKAQMEDYTDDTKRLVKKAEELKKKRDATAYIDPVKSNEHKDAGNKLFADNKFVEAIAEYSEALKRDPSNYKVLSNRAACYSKLMEWSRALEDCDACIAKDPAFAKVYIRKAKVQHFLKQYHKALETYDIGLKLEPTSSELMEGRRQTMAAISSENRTGQVDPQRAKEAMKDPEIQNILKDPAVNAALQRMQEDPKAAQSVLQDRGMAAKIDKLISAGILQIR